MRLAAAVAVLAGALSGEARADAQAFDATRALRCAPTEVAQCDLGVRCESLDLAEAEIPTLIRVDFAAKQLASPDGARTSPIRSVEVEDAALIVQGSQNGRGWSLVVERATGNMSASIAEVEGSFVLAGTCSAE